MLPTQGPRLFLLDANACNALQQIVELNELERLGRVGTIDLQYTETTWTEAQVGSALREAKVTRFVFSGLPDLDDLGLQQPWRDAIASIVFPNGIRNENQRRDVEALLTVKLAGGCFVTRDGASSTQPGGILGHTAELAAIGIEVLSFSEALECAQRAA